MIEVKNLTKQFGDMTAVDNVSFTVDGLHIQTHKTLEGAKAL